MAVVWYEETLEKVDIYDSTDKLFIVTYANGQCRQFYLNVDKRDAMERFERVMLERTNFEIEDEGWEASIETIAFDEHGECFIAKNSGDQIRRLMAELMEQYLGK